MNSQMTDANSASGTAVANTQVQVVIAATAGLRTRLCFAHFGFSGAAPAAPVQATISDGTTTVNLAVGSNPTAYDSNNPLVFATGAAVTLTLPAGGAAAVGNIAAAYYQDKP